MDFLVILSVLAITQTTVLARPTDSSPKTKRSTDQPRKPFKPTMLKFPATLENEFSVVINGTLDKTSETFEVVFPSRSRTEDEHCRIQYHFKNGTLDIRPTDPDWQAEIYTLYTKEEEEHPTFSIRLKAVTMNNQHSFKLKFEGNNGGESSMMTCQLKNFEDFESIEFKNGLHGVTSFIVEF